MGNRARWLHAGLIYFGTVFGVGFLLGPLRVLLLEPRVGARAAELLEAPVMLVAILLSARWVAARWCRGLPSVARLGVGFLAAGCVLTADLAVGVGLRGMSPLEVFTHRDPIAGPVYYGLIALTAVAPWWFGRRTSSGASPQAGA